MIKTMQDIVDWGLCVGCGTCYAACDKDAVSLENIETVGIRPHFDREKCSECNECLVVCPGYRVDGNMETGKSVSPNEGDREFGRTLEIWEGYAVDTELRYKGSSGGVTSALALYCLENENMEFVVHTGMDNERPWLNKTVMSYNRDDIVSRTGSRYSPASPCEGLKSIEQSKGKCVFIGKPCDTAGVSMLRRKNQDLDRNLGLVMAFFCAGTPSTKGTKDIISSMNSRPEHITALRYRGEGWPGYFKFLNGDTTKEHSLNYVDSWGKLNKYISFRCRICPHGLGRIADLSCGDAWHSYTENDNQGRSIVLVRTQRGKEILHKALAANYIKLEKITAREVLDAQKNLLEKRRQIFGRIFAMKLLLVPTPRFKDFSLFRSWIKLPFLLKIKTILGTLRRLLQRGLWRRQRN